MENLEIKSMADVRSFFYYLMVELELEGGFHPDTPMDEYIHLPSGDLLFAKDKARRLQKQLDKCFEVCEYLGQDIYEQGAQLGHKLGYFPRPDAEKHCVIIVYGESSYLEFEADRSNESREMKISRACNNNGGKWNKWEFNTEEEVDAFLEGMEEMDSELGGFCEYFSEVFVDAGK